MKTDNLRRYSVLAFSFASLFCIALGLTYAIHSPLFTVQVVEIGDMPENSPVDPQSISDLAAVPVGKMNLFDLDLDTVEKRILTHPWIKKAVLVKRFPQTLSISVTFRDPRALIQERSGTLAYVDQDGKVFGRVNVLARSNLPLITGVSESDSLQIAHALELITLWEKTTLSENAQLSALNWDDERGFRVWITYPTGPVRARTRVDLGREVDEVALDLQFRRLKGVIRYLSQHSLNSNQIWADSGKKIVVRTAHGS